MLEVRREAWAERWSVQVSVWILLKPWVWIGLVGPVVKDMLWHLLFNPLPHPPIPASIHCFVSMALCPFPFLFSLWLNICKLREVCQEQRGVVGKDPGAALSGISQTSTCAASLVDTGSMGTDSSSHEQQHQK